jgi:hypothetical protein
MTVLELILALHAGCERGEWSRNTEIITKDQYGDTTKHIAVGINPLFHESAVGVLGITNHDDDDDSE